MSPHFEKLLFLVGPLVHRRREAGRCKHTSSTHYIVVFFAPNDLVKSMLCPSLIYLEQIRSVPATAFLVLSAAATRTRFISVEKHSLWRVIRMWFRDLR